MKKRTVKDIVIEIHSLELLNYLLVQAKIPVVEGVSFTNQRNEDIRITDIHIQVTEGSEYLKVEEYHGSLQVPAGESCLIPLKTQIHGKALFTVQEPIQDTLMVSISYHEVTEPIVLEVPFEIMPINYWINGICPQSIAGFVAPNSPQILHLAKRASQLLKEQTGNSSFTAYLDNDKTSVRQQMAAIYATIYELQITYMVLPATFSAAQRIRTVDEILTYKTANCIEMAILFSSLAEACGLNPFIVLVPGHAFAGVWLKDTFFSESYMTDETELIKRLSKGIHDIEVVECTGMNEGMQLSFEQAVGAAHDTCAKGVDGVIDIKYTHYTLVRPMPILSQENGEIQVIDYGLADDAVHKGNSKKNIEEYFINLEQEELVDKKTIWLRNLLDISKRNQLISFKPGKRAIQLFGTNLGLLEDMLADGKSLTIKGKVEEWQGSVNAATVIDVYSEEDFVSKVSEAHYKAGLIHTFLTETELSNRLKLIHREATQKQEENGANTLYLAMGLLRWFDEKDLADAEGRISARYSPLVLLPVELVRKSSKSYFLRMREEEAQFNITLIEMLRQKYDIRLYGLNPLPNDDKGINFDAVISTVRKEIIHMEGWDVEEVAFLGNFAFSSFVLWNDIKNRFDQLTENEVVNALQTGRFQHGNEEHIDVTQLDDTFKVGDLAIPSYIDSSQLQAVIESGRGKSFILHGPPGTGKSQTITNIIANALYHGKRVLFVAEKSAALNVVAKRLDEIGLSEFCGEIHSNKTQKKTIIDKLTSVLALQEAYNSEAFTRYSDTLEMIKSEVNEQVYDIHRVREQGFSLYEIMGICNRYPASYRIIPIEENLLLHMTRSDWDSWMQLLKQVDAVRTSMKTGIYNHPLREFQHSDFSLGAKDRIEKELSKLHDCLQTLGTQLTTTHMPYMDTTRIHLLHDVEIVIRERRLKTKITNTILQQLLDEDVQESFVMLQQELEQWKPLKETVLLTYSESILQVDIPSIRRDIALAKEGFMNFFTGKSKIKKVLLPVSTLYKGEFPLLTFDEELQRIYQAQEQYRTVDKQVKSILSAFNGAIITGIDTTDAILDLSALSQVLQKYDVKEDISLQGLLLSWIEGIQEKRPMHELISTCEDIYHAFVALQSDAGIQDFPSVWNEHTIANVQDTLHRWSTHMEKWKEWTVWRHTLATLREAGLDSVVEVLDAMNGQLVGTVEATGGASLSYGLLQLFMQSSKSLNQFSRLVMEGKLSSYQELLREFSQLTAKEIRARLIGYLPDPRTCTQEESKHYATMKRFLSSKGRGLSIRELFQQTSAVMQKLQPCMLMSPLSVAQYIDLSYPKFDMVIFDEASQVKTSMAIGAMSRAKHVIVVGDPKQMPPTKFFGKQQLDDNHIEVEDLESLLDDCLAVNMPEYHLKCHYRSQSESLIAFSNREFYDGNMMTFPAPTDMESKVAFVKVDGSYDRGATRTNPDEAKAIIQRLKQHIMNDCKDSLGVITFNVTQANLIDDMWQEELEANVELRSMVEELEEPIFIKNLENVQGDERDVIYFSITYGPDENGNVYQNFGPLGQQGGWRRLNVAVTRARKEMIVVSTLQPSQITITGRTQAGVVALKNFLQYAQNTSITFGAKKNELPSNYFVISVKDYVTSLGYKVVTNLGTSQFKVPLAVISPDNSESFGCALLFDDEGYAKLPTMRDRCDLIPSVLTKMGWKLYHLWGLEWFMNPEQEKTRLAEYLQDIIGSVEVPQVTSEADTVDTIHIVNTADIVNGAEIGDVVSTKDERIVIRTNTNVILSDDKDDHLVEKQEVSVMPAVANKTGCSFYERYIPDSIRPSEDLQESYQAVIDLCHAIISVEAPIEKQLLAQRVSEVYSGVRLGKQNLQFLDRAFIRLEGKKQKKGDVLYYWGHIEPDTYEGYRVPMVDGYRRELEYIPPIELANALYGIGIEEQDVEGRLIMEERDLCKLVAKRFGFQRLTDNLYDIVKSGLRICIRRKWLVRNGKTFIVGQRNHEE